MITLDGDVIIVTAAQTEMSRGIARALVERGARVAGIGSPDGAGLFLAEVGEAAGRAIYVAADPAVVQDARRAAEEVAAWAGGIDALVNGVPEPDESTVASLGDDVLDAYVDAVVRSAYHMVQACLPHFRSAGHGRVVNLASVAGEFGDPGCAAYAIATSAMGGLTTSGAMDLMAEGVQMNMVVVNDRVRSERVDIEGLELEGVMAEVLSHHYPVTRGTDPVLDVGPVVAFFASEDAHWVTARTIYADGGQGSRR